MIIPRVIGCEELWFLKLEEMAKLVDADVIC